MVSGKTFLSLLLAAVLVLSLTLCVGAAPAREGKTARVEDKVGSGGESYWTAWYEDHTPERGPEWHNSTLDQDGNVVVVGRIVSEHSGQNPTTMC